MFNLLQKIFIYSTTVSLLHCQQWLDSPKHHEPEPNSIITAKNQGTDSSHFHIQIEHTDGDLRIKPVNVPSSASQVTCIVNQTKHFCPGGLEIQRVTDGLYIIKVIVTMPDSPLKNKQLVRTQELRIKNKRIIDLSLQNNFDHPLTLKLNPLGDFENYSSIDRNHQLKINMDIEAPDHCLQTLLCSRGNDIWARCDHKDDGEITLSSTEILRGYQSLLVKAGCKNSDDISNLVTLHWFGVDKGYSPLSISETRISNLYYFSLVKESDCLGKTSFQCRNQIDSPFIPCSNINFSIQAGFEIRAKCRFEENEFFGLPYRPSKS